MTNANRALPRIDRQFLESSPYAHVVLAPDLCVIEMNDRYGRMVGRSRSELIGRNLMAEFPPNPDDPEGDALPVVRASIGRVLSSGEPDEMPMQKHDITGPDGRYSERFWQITHAPLFADPDTRKDIVGVWQLVQDVTRVELDRRRADAQLRAASLNGAVGYFDYDPETGLLDRSDQVDKTFGYAPGEVGPKADALFARIHPDDMDDVASEIARVIGGPSEAETPSPTRLDYRILLPDGQIRWAMARGEVVRHPATGRPHLVGAMSDVTEFRAREADLHRAVEARDGLIAEVNHRVKNSLQLVTSILTLESRVAALPETRKALQSANARIHAIATIHGALYEDGDVRSIRMDSYLDRFCRNIGAAVGPGPERIEVAVLSDPLRLPTDQAIALSLVVNELVTNALRHAFTGRSSGRVDVTLRAVGSDATLTVRDNGIGGDVPQSQEPTLGSRLMAGAVSQLGGWMERKSGLDGWSNIVRFTV